MKRSLRLLIVDDEEGMRLGIGRTLRDYRCVFPDLDADADFQIQSSESAEEARTLMQTAPPDLLLLDYKLPGMSGLDLLARLRDEHPGVLTIMMTAYASLDTAIQATKLGAHDFLAKPFTPEEVRATVRKAVHHLILLEKARAAEDEKRRVRFEFISVLSHELKAPLNAIEGYLELIRSGTIQNDADRDRALDRSLSRVQGMRKLIFDLLDLTRIESGAKQRSLEEVDVVSIAREVSETMAPAAAKRSITVELDAPNVLPMGADRQELTIILNNLISNAVKYNRDGGRVDVRLSREDRTVKLEVADTGIGLSDEEAARLFKDFVRIKNEHTRGIEGSGLGLSTVKKLVRLYHGNITVTGRPGEGSTFAVTLEDANIPGSAG